MALSADTCERLAFLASSALVISVTGAVGPAVLLAAGAGLAGSAFLDWRKRIKAADPKTEKAIAKVQKKVLANSIYADTNQQDSKNAAIIKQADKLLGKHIAECWPEPNKIAKLSGQDGGFPESVAKYVVEQISCRGETDGVFDKSHANFQEVAYKFAIDTVTAAMTAALDDENYFKTLEPHILMEGLRLSGQAVTAITALQTDFSTWKTTLELLQNEILETLNRIEATGEDTNALVQQILAQMQQQSGITPDAQAEADIAKTIAGLLTAGDGARGRAGEKLAAGDISGASGELKQLAAQQEDAVADAAKTWLDIGNIAYLN
ncbi:hypothetical protein MNBD_ALPHA06-2298, partial [hydrothermal vent metagenome]